MSHRIRQESFIPVDKDTLQPGDMVQLTVDAILALQESGKLSNDPVVMGLVKSIHDDAITVLLGSAAEGETEVTVKAGDLEYLI